MPHQGIRLLKTPSSMIIMFEVTSSIPVKTINVNPTGKTRPSTSRRRPGLLVFAEGEPPTTASRNPPYLRFSKRRSQILGRVALLVVKRLTTIGCLPIPPSRTRHRLSYDVLPRRFLPEPPLSAWGLMTGDTCYLPCASLSNDSC